MRGAPPRRQRARALVFLFVWLLGFELGPSVHIGFHDLFGHHHHDGTSHGASHRHQEGHAHPAHHAPASLSHDATNDSAGPQKHSHGHGHGDPSHGIGSMEHRGVAIVSAPPPPAIRIPEFFEFCAAPEFQRTFVSTLPPRTERARGPPRGTHA